MQNAKCKVQNVKCEMCNVQYKMQNAKLNSSLYPDKGGFHHKVNSSAKQIYSVCKDGFSKKAGSAYTLFAS